MQGIVMKSLTAKAADRYLNQIGMETGDWNQLKYVTQTEQSSRKWINYRAPQNALELYNFSFHVTGWLASGSNLTFGALV